jgi:signal transduction histidine kinase
MLNQTTRKKANIVIDDDEESILKELRILLGRTYNVHVFANPEEAEVFVDNNEVDLVVSDEMMPEMRGSVLLAKIHKKHPGICKIVLSGQAEKDDIVKAVNEGHIFSFLYKPAERQQLLNVIEKGLENRNMKIKLAEQNVQLKEYSENLEKMVEEKTAQLVKAYDRLNMLDAGKMHFLVYLSEEMDSSLDRINKLAQELLTYFAFAGSEVGVNLSAVDLQQLVDSAVQVVQPWYDKKGIDLEMNINPGVTVMADRELLSGAIRVLVDNALVFSEKGDKVSITGGPIEGKIRLCIADKGKGIAKENLKKVFMPFIISKEDRNPDGFGLNLPMVKSIINAHEGDIWVESDGPGSGSRFCVELVAAM